MKNVLWEQYGVHRLTELRLSPYSCLLESNIEHAPHQIEAFIAALQALKNGGIILADEVGLGKTIEAGLIIKYLIKNGAMRILLALPPSLRKQWQDELDEKFGIKAIIPESKYSVKYRDADYWNTLTSRNQPLVVISSYGFAPWFIKRFPKVKWDCFVFDEAHRLRNLGNGAQRAKELFDATQCVPKVMLTATPLQNTLRELYALSQYIDERIFVSEKVFNDTYVISEDYKGLREALAPILHRTLRKDVSEYLQFSKRDCMAIDFKLTYEEAILYQLANEYLQRPLLYAISSQNNALVKMVVRKLLASSSYAVVETFEVLKSRLKVLKESTRAERADISLREFFNLIDNDDDDANGEDLEEDLETIERERYRAEIDNELSVVENIISMASKVKSNSKSTAVIEALQFAFAVQREGGHHEKALIFTESKRTQRYLVESLSSAGFDSIIVFNGEMNDPKTKEVYNAWRARNPKRVTNTPSIDLKQAIVEQFEHEAKILIATDAASEGLNLQFCDTVINYDLPWNPMKIEQRIGRCHRFGQSRDVWVYNLLNRENAADVRVYEILESKFNLFKGVFGASDEALGLLESGSSFEKKVMNIYEHCKTSQEFKREFDRLEREITPKRGKKSNELKQLLSTIGSDEKKKHLYDIAIMIEHYISDLEQWTEVSGCINPIYNTTLEVFGNVVNFNSADELHGYVFVGALVKNNLEFLSPILVSFDEDGEVLQYKPSDILQAFDGIFSSGFVPFTPYQREMDFIGECIDKITPTMYAEYMKQSQVLIAQNEKRIQNWIDNQGGQYEAESDNLQYKISQLEKQKTDSKFFQEKIDIQKKIDKLKKDLIQRDDKFHATMLEVNQQAELDKKAFKAQFEIEPVTAINLVVKF